MGLQTLDVRLHFFPCPLVATVIFPDDGDLEPLSGDDGAGCVLFVFLCNTVAFCVACLGFHMTSESAATTAGKNMALWMLTGELFSRSI